MSEIKPPFSARNRNKHRQIDSKFPDEARTGLAHLLYDLVEKDYVENWGFLARELHRLARLPPKTYNSSNIPSINEARSDSKSALLTLRWDRVYDFCERLHRHLAKEVSHYESEFEQIVDKTRGELHIFTDVAGNRNDIIS